MVLLLNFSSLFIVLIYSVFNFETANLEFVQRKNFCRYSLFSIQKETSKNINKLIDLNPKASSLRIKIKSTKLALAAATATLSPQVIALLKIRLKYLNYKKISLAAKQKFYLSRIHLYKESSLLKMRSLFLSKFNSKKLLHIKDHRLKFLKSPLLSVIPNYNVIGLNKINAYWSKKTNQGCSTQLKKKGGIWVPQLIIEV